MLNKSPFLGRLIGVVVLFLLGANFGHAQTEQADDPPNETESLPSLMSLEQALQAANQNTPELLKIEANSASAKAQVEEVGINTRWKASLDINARAVKPIIGSQNRSSDDSNAELSFSKLLWDFGKTANKVTAADINLESNELTAEYARRLQRIRIMRKFFNVLASDYEFNAKNEAMTLAFFPFNRAQERRERFDSVSELDVMEKQAVFFEALNLRNDVIREQRANRLKLALAMGLPSAQPDGLIEPDLAAYERELPDYDALLAKMIDANPLLKHQRAELERLKLLHDGANLEGRPNLRLKLSALDYQQKRTTRDRQRALLSLEIPLLTGGTVETKESNLKAQILREEAKLLEYDFALREQVLSWVQRLEALNSQIEQNVQNLDFRERALDKSRLLYEMEVRARIGQAQADIAKLIWRNAKLKYERALIWEQIDAVLGNPLVKFE